MVEYILLLAVVVSLVLTFVNSDLFKKYFGDQGKFGTTIKKNNEFSYRHAFNKATTDISRTSRDGANHPSYKDTTRNTSRFFGGKDPYPAN